MSSVEILSESAHPTTDQVRAKAHGAIDRVAAPLAEAEVRTRDVAAASAKRLGATQEQMKQKVNASIGTADSFVRKNAIAVTGCALAVGALAAVMVRRASRRSAEQ
jgi:ElaB/YqjD/DUF883 family membrane-anchored ribosome-binding protein